jgi:hypothetical protein
MAQVGTALVLVILLGTIVAVALIVRAALRRGRNR